MVDVHEQDASDAKRRMLQLLNDRTAFMAKPFTGNELASKAAGLFD